MTTPKSADSPLLSIEEFERLPRDGWSYELVRGRLVREPPAGFDHGRRAGRIDWLLRDFVYRHGLGEILSAETGFVLSERPWTVRAPDVAFVSAARIATVTQPEKFFPGAPDLAVEIVSLSNTLAEVEEKAFEYLDAGAQLVWVVLPDTRKVRTYRSRTDVSIIDENGTLDGEPVLSGFRVLVTAIFRDPPIETRP